MKKILVMICAIGLIATSCEEYLDVNQTPNNPTAENVPPSLVLAGAIETIYPTQVSTMNRLGNAYMNTWGPNVNSFTGGFASEFSLAIDNGFYSGIWSGLYLGINPFQTIINSEGSEYNNHKAIAMIMKSYYMQYIVDLYGDAPYSEAFKRGDNLTPKYDNDKEIYRDLIVQLDAAISLIQANNGTSVGSEDIVFGGNMTNWRKFANTVKLKVLMREATLAETNTESATYLTTQFAALDADFVTTNVTINPGYSNDSNSRLNPFYGTFGFNNEGDATSTNNFIRGSKYAIDFLTNTGDISRRNRIYKANEDGAFVGIEQGMATATEDLSGLGAGLLVSADQDGYIMTLAEVLLFQTEAVERGFLTGNAAQLFAEAQQASHDLLGSGGTGSSANYNSATNKIEAIMTEKWIAVNGINAIESWIEFNRTGFPVVPLPTTAQFPTKPVRLMYPISEFSGNAANVPTQTQNDAFNDKIFWGN